MTDDEQRRAVIWMGEDGSWRLLGHLKEEPHWAAQDDGVTWNSYDRDDAALTSFDWFHGRELRLEFEGPIDPRLMAIVYGLERTYDVTEKREYSRDEPVALDDRDPSNADIVSMVAPLEPDDNVYTLIHPDEETLRESAPVGDVDQS